MNYKKLLVIAVVLQWIFTFLSVSFGFYEEAHLEGEYLKILGIEKLFSLSFAQEILLYFGLIFTLIYFISSLGLLLVKSWTRIFYVIFYLLSMACVVLIYMPDFSTPLESLFNSLSTICFGFVLSIVYCSPLSNSFVKVKNMSDSAL